MNDDELLRNVLIKSRQLGINTEMLEAVAVKDVMTTHRAYDACPRCLHTWEEHEHGEGVCQGLIYGIAGDAYAYSVCGCTRGRGDDE
jgi:hypothetical protein